MKNKRWKNPPRIKIYEALGAISDKRIKIKGDTATVVSSSGNKEYAVEYDSQKNAITANDNGSYWKGYLGYPAIAFLLEKEIITYNKKVTRLLKGIAWKDLNTKFENDFTKTEAYIHQRIGQSETLLLEKEAKEIERQIEELNLNKLSSSRKPPEEY